MFEGFRYRYRSARRRLRRFERRELRHVQRWLEDTENLLHLSALVIVPILIGAVTLLSNVSPVVSFLVYPPLASGTYTLFADPGGRYSSPRKFVGGMTLGAFCGWVALAGSAQFWYTVSPEQLQVHAGAAALGIFLTGLTTWLFDLEEPTAYSSALLVLVTGSEQLTYVVGVAVSSALVAGVFVVWRRRFYRERARYLFQSTHGDDQILVPVRGDSPTSLALFAARIAAAHDAGKVVLMETVDPETIATTEAAIADEAAGEAAAATDADEGAGSGDATDAAGPGEAADATDAGDAADAERATPSVGHGEIEDRAPPTADADDRSGEAVTGTVSLDADVTQAAEEQITAQLLDRLEYLREQVTSVVDVPCEFVVAVEDGSPGATVLDAAETENCDLIVAPYETEDGEHTAFVRTVLSGPTDAVVFRPSNGRTEWARILVMVRSPGEVANAMLDFAHRLVAPGGTISACTCITARGERRAAEIRLETLVESFSRPFETRIAHGSAETFLERNASHYDLAVIGASTDRSVASRFFSTPTFERVRDVECDLAIVHRG